jgi:hypothetical protein
MKTLFYVDLKVDADQASKDAGIDLLKSNGCTKFVESQEIDSDGRTVIRISGGTE